MKREFAFLTVGLILGLGLSLAFGAVSGHFGTGRYAISAWDKSVYIIDTTTGEFWERRPGKHVFKRGTIANPLWEPRTLSDADTKALMNFRP